MESDNFDDVQLPSFYEGPNSGELQESRRPIQADLKFFKLRTHGAYGGREVARSLLSSGEVNASYVEKILDQNIAYGDFSCLTDTDLEKCGITDKGERALLLKHFKRLPNQNPSFESICDEPEASTCNSRIFQNACDYLDTMSAAIALTNYKLQTVPTEDVLLGDKNFASHFVLAALGELKSASDEITSELNLLEELVTPPKSDLRKSRRKKKFFNFARWTILSSVAAGTLAVLIWKFR